MCTYSQYSRNSAYFWSKSSVVVRFTCHCCYPTLWRGGRGSRICGRLWKILHCLYQRLAVLTAECCCIHRSPSGFLLHTLYVCSRIHCNGGGRRVKSYGGWWSMFIVRWPHELVVNLFNEHGIDMRVTALWNVYCRRAEIVSERSFEISAHHLELFLSNLQEIVSKILR